MHSIYLIQALLGIHKPVVEVAAVLVATAAVVLPPLAAAAVVVLPPLAAVVEPAKDDKKFVTK